MDDERRNDVGGGIVVGCLALGLLVAVLMLGAAGVWFYRSVRIGVEQQATVEEAEARQVQVADITEEEKATAVQGDPQPQFK